MYSLDMIDPKSLENVKEIKLKMKDRVKHQFYSGRDRANRYFTPTGVGVLIQRRKDSEG